MADGNGKTPFYKRELSLRRGRSAKPGRARTAKRHKKLVGLTVGASQLAAAEVVNNGHAHVVKVARQPLERGVVVGGELRDPEALSRALKTFFRKNKLPRRRVRLGIANNRIGVRIFELEGIDDPKQLENAIWFRAQDALPVGVEHAVLDYHVLERRLEDDGSVVWRVLLVVAYREAIERYVAACRAAGVKLVGVDLEAFALLRALGPSAVDSTDAATVVVSVGHDRATLAVSDGDVCEFTRVLDWGGFALDVAVARVLNLTPGEVEPIRQAVVLSGSGTPAGLSAEQTSSVREAIERQVDGFARELVSALRFYQDQAGSRGLGEVVLTGGTSHLSGFAERLGELLGVPVRVGDPLASMKTRRRVKADTQVGSLAGAIGLGIEV